MGRIIAIDYGLKRTGIAATDPLKIVANSLTTVETTKLFDFLKQYIKNEEVEAIVIGEPKKLNGNDTHTTQPANKLASQLGELFPQVSIYRYDERFTSKIALQTMISAGTSKKYRQDKGNIDKLSAVIILQDWMQRNGI